MAKANAKKAYWDWGAVNPKVEDYLKGLANPQDANLKAMEKYAKKMKFPYVGPEVGNFLAQITRIRKAKKVFELGSGFGYSAYWFAQAIPASGKVYLTDSDPDKLERAARTFKKAKLIKKAVFCCGDAIQSLKDTKGSFDIYYLDCNKEVYPTAFKIIEPRMRKGDLLIADNLLMGGKIHEKSSKNPQVKAMRSFTKLCFNNKRLSASIIPLRDGVLLAEKL